MPTKQLALSNLDDPQALKEALRIVVTALEREHGVNGPYISFKGSMSATLKKLGINTISTPTMIRLIQELGLARYRRDHGSLWDVLSSVHFDRCVTDEWLRTAMQRVHKHFEVSDKLRQLKKQELSAPAGSRTNELDQEALDTIATLVAVNDSFVEQIENLQRRIAELEAEKKSPSASDILNAAIERVTKQK